MYTEQQQKLRDNDRIKIARTFTQSPFIYQGDSKQRVPNPDYHQPICQRENGTFCDVEGRTIALKDVPDYIKNAGKPPKLTPESGKRSMSLADAMIDATRANQTADTPARPRRGRKARAA